MILDYNKIQEFPKEILGLKQLEELSIQNNQFQKCPSILLELKSLKTLFPANNPFLIEDNNEGHCLKAFHEQKIDLIK